VERRYQIALERIELAVSKVKLADAYDQVGSGEGRERIPEVLSDAIDQLARAEVLLMTLSQGNA